MKLFKVCFALQFLQAAHQHNSNSEAVNAECLFGLFEHVTFLHEGQDSM